MGGNHQNKGRRIKTGMNLWGFYCCFLGGKEHYFHMRVILSRQININADLVMSWPIRNSLSSESNTSVFMWIGLRNLISLFKIGGVCNERAIQANVS